MAKGKRESVLVPLDCDAQSARGRRDMRSDTGRREKEE